MVKTWREDMVIRSREELHPYSTISIKMKIYQPSRIQMEKTTDFDNMSEYVCYLLEREMKNV